MNEKNPDLKTELRAAETSARTAQAEVNNLKGRRVSLGLMAAAGGFLVAAVGGHWFPGYQLDSTAQTSSTEVAQGAVSEVMAQLCAERFLQETGFDERMTGLNEASGTYSKARYVREGAWAADFNGKQTDQRTAEKCSNLIAKHVSDAAEKTS